MHKSKRIAGISGASLLLVALFWLALEQAHAEPGSPTAPQLVLTLVGESEPNNQTGDFDAFGCGDIATGVIGVVGDHDVWAMTGNTGDLVFAVVDATGSVPSPDTFLSVLADVTSTVVISDNDSGWSFASAVAGVALPMGGRVYFVVSENGDDSTISYYELDAVVISSTNSAAEVESNNFYTQANTISRAIMTGTVPNGDAADYFKFPANYGDHIVIIMDDDPDKNGNRLDSAMSLLAVDGITALSAGDDLSGNQANATRVITAPETGIYYVRIAEGGNPASGDKAYRFVVLVNGRPVAGDPPPCFAKLRITHVGEYQPDFQQGVFTATVENIGNVRGPARMVTQYPLGISAQSCSFSVGNSGGSISVFQCETGPNGTTSEYGVTFLRPGGSMRGTLRVKPLASALLARSPQSQTVPFGGTAHFTVGITNTGSMTLTDFTLTDALLGDCARTSPIATGYPFNSLPPGTSASYTCSQPSVTARIQSTLALSIPVFLQNTVAAFIVGPNGELDQQGASAGLVMPDVVATTATVVEVQVFRRFLPLLRR